MSGILFCEEKDEEDEDSKTKISQHQRHYTRLKVLPCMHQTQVLHVAPQIPPRVAPNYRARNSTRYDPPFLLPPKLALVFLENKCLYLNSKNMNFIQVWLIPKGGSPVNQHAYILPSGRHFMPPGTSILASSSLLHVGTATKLSWVNSTTYWYNASNKMVVVPVLFLICF